MRTNKKNKNVVSCCFACITIMAGVGLAGCRIDSPHAAAFHLAADHLGPPPSPLAAPCLSFPCSRASSRRVASPRSSASALVHQLAGEKLLETTYGTVQWALRKGRRGEPWSSCVCRIPMYHIYIYFRKLRTYEVGIFCSEK